MSQRNTELIRISIYLVIQQYLTELSKLFALIANNVAWIVILTCIISNNEKVSCTNPYKLILLLFLRRVCPHTKVYDNWEARNISVLCSSKHDPM